MSSVAPLTPPEADLQDFPFMPLHVARLRDSNLAAEEEPEACWYALLLWAISWHQLPAGSLPDNEVVLTKLLGLGRDVETFRKHRSGALRGFVKCSDGRLYHPVVAEAVCTSWEGKLKQRWATECARIKKHNQRHGTDLVPPTFEEFKAGRPEIVPEPVPRDTAICPSGNDLQGKGIGIEIGKKNPPKAPLGGFSAEFEQAWATYPEEGRGTTNRSRCWDAWRAAAAEVGADALLAAVKRFATSPLVVGPKAKAPPKFHVWLDGRRYDAFLAGPSLVSAWTGPGDIRAAFVKAMGEPWTRSYVDPSDWRGPPAYELIPRTRAAFRAITEEAAEVVADKNLTVLEKAA